MPLAASPVVDRLVADAEIDAERMIGLVRIAVALVLAGWLWLFTTVVTPVEGALAQPFFVAGVALGGFFVVGVSSLVLAGTRRFRPWMAFVFTACDAAIVALANWVILERSALNGNWITAMPGIWAVPLLLTVGILRYRPVLQVWATSLFIITLLAVVVLRGFEAAGPTQGGVAPVVQQLFSLTPTLSRAVLVALMGLVGALAMRRARALLMRAVREASLRAGLSRFLPPEIAPLIEPGRVGPWREGRRQSVTILFVDIRDSTALAEGMDPKRLSVLISAFRRRVLRAADAAGGVVDKFIGDGALILFGLPEPRPDDASRAIACARELIRLIERWNAKRRFDPPIRIGIGVHTGEVYCGIVGHEARLEFTVLGDPVNVAARIEEATKQFGLPLLASQTTVAAAGELGGWHPVSAEPLRGRSGAVMLLSPSDVAAAA